MVANIIKTFKSHDKIFKLVSAPFDKKESFRILFHTCHLIFSTLGQARFLTDSEIKTLEVNVVNLSELIFLKLKIEI